MTPPKDAWSVKLTDAQTTVFALFLNDQLTLAQNAKAYADSEVDYWWMLYEQARLKSNQGKRAQGADLTSHIGTEQVDSIHARIMKTVFGVEPVCIVEGWGEAAERAPFVEEFHQWKLEESRLQSVIDRLVLQCLVEPRGLLEISEGTERRTARKRITAAVEVNPETGATMNDAAGNPMLRRDPTTGDFVPAQGDEEGVELAIDSSDRIRTGPVFRVIPYRDSIILPGHARDPQDIWGYGKRFTRREDELLAKATGPKAVYDLDAVERLRGSGGRTATPSLTRSGMTIAPQEMGQQEHDLWELLVLVDLERLFIDRGVRDPIPTALRGERWYLTTIHPDTQSLLRVQHDDFERSRFVNIILNPRNDRATEGYSLIGHKLITVIEEHTTWRNMTADKAAVSLNAPIKRLTGALWDPEEQPMGAGQVIDVRDMREIEPMVIAEQTAGGFQFMEQVERTAQRLGGVNDVASGQTQAGSGKTLGEIQMATEQSFVRMDLLVRRFQEGLEDVMQICHVIHKRVVQENPDGVDLPTSVIQSLEGRGVSIDKYLPNKKVMASLLEGAFRFKPHGNTQNADRNVQKQNTVALLDVLPKAMMAFPMLQPLFGSPQAARAVGRMIARDFGGGNMQAFIGNPAQDLQLTAQVEQQTLQGHQLQLLQGMMGGPGGAPAPGQPPLPPGGPNAPPGAPPTGPPGPPMPATPGGPPRV